MLAKKILTAVMIIAPLILSPNIFAENYELTLTRKSKNIYKVSGNDILVQTRYCYAYAYSEEAIFKTDGYGGELIFLNSNDRCDVKAVFGKDEYKPGKYSIRVSMDDDDWFEVYGENAYIHTSGCLSLALVEDSFLIISSSGYGDLLFSSGTKCTVEGIYSKIRI
ncbi:hypothetical protein SJS40_07150 [Aeromonas caviae]|uniref:hypothetical protein n=1 Tax=Aeromonas caviae TaxID=648 RepID=UPI0029D7BDC5|nr:hypothetical protein [Aeromonas caviae]MDX7753337.1 hypothetical protein [Aeromonas caviae]MDX7774087.1 hypothetical protein [Aeromonas caviae]